MTTHQILYENLLCHYSNQLDAINLLREYRPYFELIPSLRRPTESLISIPLPVVSLANGRDGESSRLQLLCDVALLMCDPEWKIKTGQEIFIFIHRPGEEFSELLNRWRQVEVSLGNEYYWLLPWKYHQIQNDHGEYHYPLFVTLSYTSERIKRGLEGASLPFVYIELPEQNSSAATATETAIADQN